MKTRSGGQWTEARFNSFIKGALRATSRKWGPIGKVKKAARVRRGVYLCAGCGEEGPATIPNPDPAAKRRRLDNACVDHIEPIIDPATGFTSWDDVIARMFVEADRLQVLCHPCHKAKTAAERKIADARRAAERDA